MTIAIFVVAGQSWSSGSSSSSSAGPQDRSRCRETWQHRPPSAEGGHQGRSPGADGGGMSYYNGG